MAVKETVNIEVKCSFCGKPASEVKKMVAGNFRSAICDECIEVCENILQEEKAKKELRAEEILINKPCLITPFENLKGTILAIFITKKGIEYQVRYYLDGNQNTDYFFDWEIQML